MFVQGFERFLVGHGLEMRWDRFALFQNIYRPGASEHLELARGRELFDAFFRLDPHDIDPAAGASDALAAWAREASILILTNAPPASREPRRNWLARHGLAYPLLIGAGPKGPTVAQLAARTRGPVAFIDDLLSNLDSVGEAAPAVKRFQMIADPRLRPLAPCAPERHQRVDEWPALTAAVADALGLSAPGAWAGAGPGR